MAEDAALAAELAPWALAEIHARFFPKRYAAMMRAVKASQKLDRNQPQVMAQRDLERRSPQFREQLLQDHKDFIGADRRIRAEIEAAAYGLDDALRRSAARPNAFCAYARMGSPSASLSRIPIDLLASFRSVDWTTSTVVVGVPSEEYRLYSVRLVPSLVAPDAQSALIGSLEQLIVGQIWGAPEIAAIAEGAVDKVNQHLHGDGALRIAIASDARKIAEQLDQALTLPWPDQHQRHTIVSVAAARLERLFHLIKFGQLKLSGVDGRSSLQASIPAEAWMELGVSLCLSGAAVYRGDELIWRDLEIGKLAKDLQPEAAAKAEPEYQQDEANTGRPPELQRLTVLHQLIAGRLAGAPSIFASKTELSRLFAQEIQRAGLPLGNQHRGRKVPTQEPVTDSQVRSAGEWIGRHFPELYEALTGKANSQH